MTPDRLAFLKEHIRNPPSVALNREWMMELVEALENRGCVVPVASPEPVLSTLTSPVVPIPPETLPVGLPEIEGGTIGMVAVTPPERPTKKAKK